MDPAREDEPGNTARLEAGTGVKPASEAAKAEMAVMPEESDDGFEVVGEEADGGVDDTAAGVGVAAKARDVADDAGCLTWRGTLFRQPPSRRRGG